MKNLVLLALMTINLQTAFAQKRPHIPPSSGIAVAFLDTNRLRGQTSDTTVEDFEFFSKRIQEIVKRDFPGVEFKILKRGELLQLPDGTGLNLETLHPELGYVLAARGRKRRILSGIQSDGDFACAAVSFFRRPSSACPR
jgi:hypothetical protein